MTPELLRVESLAGPGFSETSFQLAPGQWLRLSDGPRQASSALVDAIYGIGPAYEGEVFWSDVPISTSSETDLLEIAARTSFVHPRSGLLVNLRVWENLILPLKHHHRQIDLDALETEIIDTFAIAGIGEADAARILNARTDDLTPSEILFALLIRAHCEKPALIVCESAFNGLTKHALESAIRILEHTAAQCPGLALLTIGDPITTLDPMAINTWPNPETRTWKASSWLAT